MSVGVVETQAQADELLASVPEERRAGVLVGTADVIADRVANEILSTGLDGVIVNAPRNGHAPGVVEAIGAALAPLVR